MNDSRYDDAYAACLEQLRSHDAVLGVILGGSRALGLETATSDTDLYVIHEDSVRPRSLDALRSSLEDRFRDALQLDLANHAVQGLRQFASHAVLTSATAWDRPNLIRARLEFDKTDGKLASVLDGKRALGKIPATGVSRLWPGFMKGRPPMDELTAIMIRHFGGFIQNSYRALKASKNGQHETARYCAAELLPDLLWVYFGLDDRVRPFNQNLRWELENFPLQRTAIDSTRFLQLLQAIVECADPDPVRVVFTEVAQLARERGYHEALDSWGDKLQELLPG